MLMIKHHLQFLDMSSLETALPSTQLINDYLAGVAQPWNSQNAAATYISSLPEGKMLVAVL